MIGLEEAILARQTVLRAKLEEGKNFKQVQSALLKR